MPAFIKKPRHTSISAQPIHLSGADCNTRTKPWTGVALCLEESRPVSLLLDNPVTGTISGA